MASDDSPDRSALTATSASRFAIAVVMTLAIVGLAWMLMELTRFFMLVFAAIVLAVVFNALADRLCRLSGMGRGPALAVSVLALLGIFVGAFILFGAQLAGEFDTIHDTIPQALAALDGAFGRIGIDLSPRELVERAAGDLSSLTAKAGGYAIAATSGVADFVLVLVGAIFLAASPATYRRGLLLLIPARAEDIVDTALDDASRGLRGWMVGQSMSSLVVAGLTWAGLAALDVPASAGLGLIAGLLDVIPMVGPIIAGVPAVLLAFTVSPITAVWTIALFLIIQQLQGNFLQPMIQKQAVDVPPALLLFAVVAAGMLFGPLGVLLAAPLTVVTFVGVQRIYVRTLLGKPIEIAGGE